MTALESLGEAIKGTKFIKWLEEAKARARRAAEGSPRNNSIASVSAIKQYECEKCKDEPQSKLIPVIDPDTGKQAVVRRPIHGPNNAVIGYQDIPQEQWVDVVCECTEWKAAKKRLKSSGIAEEFQRLSFGDYKTEGKHHLFATALRTSKQYVELAVKDYFSRIRDKKRTKENGLLLCGEPGAGKTTLIFAIGNALLSRKVPVLYFQHREEFNRIKNNGFEDGGLYQRLREFRGVLLWDDLFKTKKRDKNGNRDIADWEADASWDIINHRSQLDLPTVFSTEWSPAELMSLDRSFAGRMIDRCKHPSDMKQDRLVWFRLTREEREQGLDPVKVFDHRFMRIERDET
ncbi:ATP-binding protein [Paenibacillus sp. SM 69]|nr:ATP-binding protein [Paenibacillus oleatilyticus]